MRHEQNILSPESRSTSVVAHGFLEPAPASLARGAVFYELGIAEGHHVAHELSWSSPIGSMTAVPYPLFLRASGGLPHVRPFLDMGHVELDPHGRNASEPFLAVRRMTAGNPVDAND